VLSSFSLNPDAAIARPIASDRDVWGTYELLGAADGAPRSVEFWFADRDCWRAKLHGDVVRLQNDVAWYHFDRRTWVPYQTDQVFVLADALPELTAVRGVQRALAWLRPPKAHTTLKREPVVTLHRPATAYTFQQGRWHPQIVEDEATGAVLTIEADQPAGRVSVSLASVMGPPGCHDLGTTRAA
jgi:hypothetical protein